ncbi:MAG: fibronectin type III domain-containing protein [Methanoregula sp.]|nr:fibronectin type III domain-containing protein [Methanoregula sp.]
MKHNFFVFFIIICCLLTVPFFLSGPAAADDSGIVTITGRVLLVIYNISVTGIDTSHATISWQTNGDANSTVEYGTTTGYGSFSTNGVMVKDHTISLSGLSPGRVYHFRVISGDLYGNRAVSADMTFTTAFPPTPPTTRPTTAPTPTPTPIPYYSGGGGGGGGGHRIYTFTGPWTLPQAGLPVQTQQTGQPRQPDCPDQVSRNYTEGFAGLIYNADSNNTLDLDISKALALGATVTVDTDHIDVYQNKSSGVLLRFRLDTSDIRNTTRIVKHVNSAELWTDPLAANFTTGTFYGSLHAMPTRILQPSTIHITLSGCIPSEVTEMVLAVSEQNNLELEKIAYTMDVTWIDLRETSAADVTMTLPASWVDQRGGSDSVHIAGINGETGITELLKTTVVGRDTTGTGTFRGDSSHGASMFAIFSARQTSPQQQEQVQNPQNTQDNLILIAAILIIVIIALAIIILLFAQRKKKKA